MQDNTLRLQKRAKRKFFNEALIFQFIDLKSPLEKAYWQTYYCSHVVTVHSEGIQSRFCKRMWCKICNPIRTAVRIKKYEARLNDVAKNLHFTTLTCKSVPAAQVPEEIKKVRDIFHLYRKNYRRTEKKEFQGTYNVEVTYNVYTGLFHPHFHILHTPIPVTILNNLCIYKRSKFAPHNIISKASVIKYNNSLITYFLKNYHDATIAGQDTRICNDIIEAFKYSNKTEYKINLKTDENKKTKGVFIPVRELDLLFQNLKGLRLFQPFGLPKIENEKSEDEEIDELTGYEIEAPSGSYTWEIYDWYNQANHELSQYEPNEKQFEYYDKLRKNEHYQNRKKAN